MSINEIKSKIKSFATGFSGSDLYIVFVVIIVAFGSFGLGRLSNTSGVLGLKQISVVPTEQSNLATVVESKKAQLPANNQFVASKRGKKYYPTDCPSAQSIKAENKIYFNSSNDAEKAGYSASSSC